MYFSIPAVFSVILVLHCQTASGQDVSTFSKWVPKFFRYCEQLSSSNNSAPLIGGIACGATAFWVMGSLRPVQISSTATLGLINVGYITTEALKTEKAFWKACKPYMIRIFDGMFNDVSTACTLATPAPPGLPACTNTEGNLLYRTGSGYCMSQKICGATTLIEFMASKDGKSTLYSWDKTTTESMKSFGYSVVSSCYGYASLANPTMSDTTITTADEFF